MVRLVSIANADFLKRKLWLSILTGQLFDITAFCINRKNSVYRFVRLQGGTMVYYNDNELIIRNMEVLSEYMSNEAISRMGRVSGIRINLGNQKSR